MKFFPTFIAVAAALLFLVARLHAAPVSEAEIEAAFAQRTGAFLIVNCASGETTAFGNVAEGLPPCSTFKIWNTLIGLELGILNSPDEPFYKWDGQPQRLPDWNRDLTLREAYRVSCVPGYQQLARKIGVERMNAWLQKIGYGNGDTSSGIDVFWLPAPERKTILISPTAQAELIRRLVTGQLPISEHTRTVLKEVMKARETPRGTLYGKTGTSGKDWNGGLGWYVGYVESRGHTYAFACDLQGGNPMGKDARAIVETVLEKSGLL